MRAETEVVRFQPYLRGPKPESKMLEDSAFTPENFTSKGLLELVVIPKDAPGGYRSLQDIRRAKEHEMSAGGFDYKIYDEKSGYQQFSFPPETFHVRIKRPYHLLQCYTESPKAFFILTSGDPQAQPGNGRVLQDNIRTIEVSLSDYLEAVALPLKPEIDLSGFKGFWRMWLFFNVPLFLLMALPKSNPIFSRLNFIGRSLMLSINVSGLVGFLIPCVSYRIGWGIWRSGALLFAALALLGPWICWLIARRFYGTDEKRVFYWSLLAALPLAALDLDSYFHYSLPDPVSEIIFSSTFAFAATGMAFGLIFALVMTLPNRMSMRTSAQLLLLLLAFAVAPARAQTLSDSEILASTPKELARRIQREKAGYDYREDAVKSIRQNGNYFDR